MADPQNIPFACELCQQQFLPAQRLLMERHVAIFHSRDVFSTFQCDLCQQMYYDQEHFMGHSRTTRRCEFARIVVIPLLPHMPNHLRSLTSQMILPTQVAPQEPQQASRAVGGDQNSIRARSERPSAETSSRSMANHEVHGKPKEEQAESCSTSSKGSKPTPKENEWKRETASKTTSVASKAQASSSGHVVTKDVENKVADQAKSMVLPRTSSSDDPVEMIEVDHSCGQSESSENSNGPSIRRSGRKRPFKPDYCGPYYQTPPNKIPKISGELELKSSGGDNSTMKENPKAPIKSMDTPVSRPGRKTILNSSSIMTRKGSESSGSNRVLNVRRSGRIRSSLPNESTTTPSKKCEEIDRKSHDNSMNWVVDRPIKSEDTPDGRRSTRQSSAIVKETPDRQSEPSDCQVSSVRRSGRTISVVPNYSDTPKTILTKSTVPELDKSSSVISKGIKQKFLQTIKSEDNSNSPGKQRIGDVQAKVKRNPRRPIKSEDNEPGRSYACEIEMKIQISKRILLRRKATHIKCSICNSKLRAIDQKNTEYPMYMNLRQHAEIHLSKPTFSCGHCHVRESTTSRLRQHLLKTHQLPYVKGNYRPLSKEQCDELTEMIMECFFTKGSGKKGKAKEIPKVQLKPKSTPMSLRSTTVSQSPQSAIRPIPESNQSSLSLSDLKIFFTNSEAVHCHLCNVDVTLAEDTAEEDALGHAANHIGKSLYSCRTCPRRFRHLSGIYDHLEVFHKMKKVGEDMYDDLRQECEADLKSVVSICYSRSEVRLERMKMDDESNFEESMAGIEDEAEEREEFDRMEDSDAIDDSEDDEKEEENEEEDGIKDDDEQESPEDGEDGEGMEDSDENEEKDGIEDDDEKESSEEDSDASDDYKEMEMFDGSKEEAAMEVSDAGEDDETRNSDATSAYFGPDNSNQDDAASNSKVVVEKLGYLNEDIYGFRKEGFECLESSNDPMLCQISESGNDLVENTESGKKSENAGSGNKATETFESGNECMEPGDEQVPIEFNNYGFENLESNNRSGNESAFEPPIVASPPKDQQSSKPTNHQVESLGQSLAGFEDSALLEHAFKCQTCAFLTNDEVIMEKHVRMEHRGNSYF